MKEKATSLLIISILISVFSCNAPVEYASSDEETWKLGWRMIESTWDKNYGLAEMQFDSLLSTDKQIDEVFLIKGLKAKLELSKEEEVLKILASQPEETQRKVCGSQIAKDLNHCADQPEEKIKNKELQLEVIKLFVADQAIRGNVMRDMISKYQLDSTTIKIEYTRTIDEVNVDEVNRSQLKEMIKEFGFPTHELIGKVAMRGVFFIIQHADGDKEWQESQLTNIELGIEKGDFSKKDYAYLYDRIKVNHGQQQRYGTQFLKVDREKQIAELRDTENLGNLNQRRRETGLMPIELYKKLILRD